MTRFPIQYDVEIERGAVAPYELSAANRPRILSGPPPEFGGTDAWWSPEHLLVSAASACFAATFFAAAERAHVRIGGYRGHAKGILDRTPSGGAFTSVHLSVRVHVSVDDVQRTRELLEASKKQCFVANSLRCPVELSIEVTPS